MVHWAAPNKPAHEVLLALAAYEKAKPYKVDLLQGKWVEAPKPPQGQPQDEPQNAPDVDPLQKEIADLEAQLAKLQMPKIPLCSEEQLKAISDKAMQAGMERDLVAALQAYGATPMAGPEDAARSTTRGGVDNPVRDGHHKSATASPATRTNRTNDNYGPPAGDPRFPGGPPGATPANGAHAPWPTGGVLQVRNVRALVQRLCDGGPHPTTAHHTNAAGTDRAVAARHTGAKCPHSPGISGLSPPPPRTGRFTQVGAQTIYTVRTTGRQMMRPGPHLTPAADAKATTGAGSRARTTARNATTTPTPTTAPIPTPTLAQAHRESREPQGTTLAQTTAQQSSCAVWPPPWTHSQQGTCDRTGCTGSQSLGGRHQTNLAPRLATGCEDSAHVRRP